MYSLEECR